MTHAEWFFIILATIAASAVVRYFFGGPRLDEFEATDEDKKTGPHAQCPTCETLQSLVSPNYLCKRCAARAVKDAMSGRG